ncbi:MAG TPA: hypothetical protein VK457_08690, partial [Chloroflexota bacterium]|nr:hypothetical protein [Chloroflexota bacterium]
MKTAMKVQGFRFPTGLMLLLPLALAACGGGTTSPASTAAISSAAKPAGSGTNASLQSIIDAANKEGQMMLWADNPMQADVAKVNEAFNSRFGTNIKMQVTNMAAGDARTRITADAQAGHYDVDVISQMSTDMIP